MMIGKMTVKGKAEVGGNLFIVTHTALAPGVVHLIGHIIAIVVLVVAVELPSELMVVELLVSQIVAQQPLCLEPPTDVIVGVAIELEHTLLLGVAS